MQDLKKNKRKVVNKSTLPQVVNEDLNNESQEEIMRSCNSKGCNCNNHNNGYEFECDCVCKPKHNNHNNNHNNNECYCEPCEVESDECVDNVCGETCCSPISAPKFSTANSVPLAIEVNRIFDTMKFQVFTEASAPNGEDLFFEYEVVSVNGCIKTIKNISSLNFRFPHFIKNCSLNIYPYIVSNGNIKNTLIISPPGAGKTTYLRDLIYQISNRENLLNILVIDERNEITCVFDGENFIKLKNIDVYSNCTKKFAFNNGIRSMKPDVIFTDEINIDKDLDDIENALTCGVKIISTIHAYNINDLKNKQSFFRIIDKRLFDRFVVLSNDNGVGTLDGIYNENLKLLGV